MEVIISNYDSKYRFKAVIIENYAEIAFETDSYSELKKKLKIRVVRKSEYEEFYRDLKNNFREIRKKVERVIYCEDGDVEMFNHFVSEKEKMEIENFKEEYMKLYKKVFEFKEGD